MEKTKINKKRPRLAHFLNNYFLFFRNAMACGRAGQKPFHAWSIIVMHISHLLLGNFKTIYLLVDTQIKNK